MTILLEITKREAFLRISEDFFGVLHVDEDVYLKEKRQHAKNYMIGFLVLKHEVSILCKKSINQVS